MIFQKNDLLTPLYLFSAVSITIPANQTTKGAPSTGGQVWKYKTYKIMPRSSNAHAYVNAGFRALVDTADNLRVVGRPSLVFGGISPTYVHAANTEDYLTGRSMKDHNTFLEAMATLSEELCPANAPELASPLYRKQLAMGLFYKVKN